MISRLFTAALLSLPLIGANAIFALGIVLMYRASRVLNLAHGAMAMVPAYVAYSLSNAGVPLGVAVPLAVAFGAVLGMAVEWVFVRRLRSQGVTAQTVGTVAALGLMVAVAARVWHAVSRTAPELFPRGRLSIGLSSITTGQLGLFAVMLVVAGALWLLIQQTNLGLKMRGTAEDRRAASLMGVNPDFITSMTWALGGALAALGGILLASVTSLHPYTLALQVLPAFIAALIAGMVSLPGAVLGAAIVGVIQGLVPVIGSLNQIVGGAEFLLALLAMAVMAARGARYSAADLKAEL